MISVTDESVMSAIDDVVQFFNDGFDDAKSILGARVVCFYYSRERIVVVIFVIVRGITQSNRAQIRLRFCIRLTKIYNDLCIKIKLKKIKIKNKEHIRI